MRRDLERWMQRSSLVVSIAAIGLMAVGLALLVARGAALSGPRAVPLSALTDGSSAPFGLMATSLGLLLLALLPSLRVLLAALLYARKGKIVDAIVAAVVLLELLFSLVTGRG